MTEPKTVTLVDGREVDSTSWEWRNECLVRWRHVLDLQRITSAQGRRDALARLAKEEGTAMAERVADQFRLWWNETKAAAKAAVQ